MPTSTPYVTSISNIKATPTSTGFTVTCETDVPVLLAMDYWAQNDPSLPAPLAGSILEGVLHVMTPPRAAPHGPHLPVDYFFRSLADDVSGKTCRSYRVSCSCSARAPWPSERAAVRFNMYGDGTRPVDGDGTGALKNGPNAGNWSSYQWTQYNPKGRRSRPHDTSTRGAVALDVVSPVRSSAGAAP